MRYIFIILGLMLFFGCLGQSAITIKQIKDDPEKYLGEQVNVKGTVRNSFKLGELSGFTLDDGTESMLVSSESLPQEGKNVTVRGTVMHEALVGYYILAKEIS